jgi:hypothetical protein
MPLRLTILHFAQRGFIDDDTFIFRTPLKRAIPVLHSQSSNYTTFFQARRERCTFDPALWQSQYHRLAIRYRYGVLEMSG